MISEEIFGKMGNISLRKCDVMWWCLLVRVTMLTGDWYEHQHTMRWPQPLHQNYQLPAPTAISDNIHECYISEQSITLTSLFDICDFQIFWILTYQNCFEHLANCADQKSTWKSFILFVIFIWCKVDRNKLWIRIGILLVSCRQKLKKLPPLVMDCH